MNEARQAFARTLPQDVLVAEYDRAMEDRAQLADLHGAAHEAMEQFRAERDLLKARVAELEMQLAIDDSWRVGNFYGPCAHGRDPYTRCDEGCEVLEPREAMLRAERAACANMVRDLHVPSDEIGSHAAGYMSEKLDVLEAAIRARK